MGMVGCSELFCKLHEKSLDNGLILPYNDNALYDTLKPLKPYKRVVLYIEHMVILEDVEPSELSPTKPKEKEVCNERRQEKRQV